MSIVMRVGKQGERIKKIEEALNIREGEKDKKIKVKIPRRLRFQVKKRGMVNIALMLYPNYKAEFKKAIYKDGLIWVGKDSYGYDQSAIYHLKNTPFTIIYSWRLIPVGGMVEETNSRLMSATEEERKAAIMGITNYGQQTIIRGIEQAELEKDAPKKKGMGIIMWVILGVGAIYVLSQFFGG